MPRITLPDGSIKEFDHPVTAGEVAASIGAGLAKAALGARVDGELVDLNRPIDHDAAVAIVTPKNRDGAVNPDALFLIRHSAAHVMAEAILHFHPDAQLVYGPPVDNGFFYDIAFPTGQSLSSDDFEKIEAKMKEIIAEDRPFTRYELPLDKGFEKLKAEGSKYKLDNANRAVSGGSKGLSWYVTGEPTDEQINGKPFDPGEDVEDSRFESPEAADHFRKAYEKALGYRW